MSTGYDRLTPWQARVVLIVAALATGFCLWVAVSPLWQGNAERARHGAGDAALYRAEIERIHNGQGYYQSAAAELTARGYPTRSVFNWRTPLPMWLIGQLPQVQWAKYVLGALSLGLIVFAFEALGREKDASFGIGLGCVVLLSGPLLFTLLDGLYVMPILWAAVLIAFSACAYGADRPKLGLGLGLTALFIRELALPYCLLSAGMAWWKMSISDKGDSPIFATRKLGQSPWELAGWGLGLAAWLIFYGWHVWIVSGLIAPDALAHGLGYFQFGGAGFVLATAQMNAYLILLPPWVTALYFAAAMFGLAGWNTPFGTRIGLTACLYVMAFSIVGQYINQYWGSIIAPFLCFGVVRFPASVRDLCRALGGNSGSVVRGDNCPITPGSFSG